MAPKSQPEREPLPPFGRRPALLQPGSLAPPTDEAWQAGDIAECLVDGQWRLIGGQVIRGPALGDRNRVVSLREAACRCPNCAAFLFLEFPGFGEQAYASNCFRKVAPQADAQVAAEPDFLDRWIRQPGLIAALGRWQRRVAARIAAALATTVFCLVLAPAIAAFYLQVPQ